MKYINILLIISILITYVNSVNINNNVINIHDNGDGDDSSNSNSNYVYKYNELRSGLVEKEQEVKMGYNVPFTVLEEQANTIFTSILQNEELSLSNDDPSSVNFFLEKQIIENESTVFKIIQKMPKGSALHIHIDSSATYDYLISSGTYLPNCYIYLTNDVNEINKNGTFHFFNAEPTDSNWIQLEQLRKGLTNVSEFDQQLLNSLTLVSEDYGDYVELWRKFDGIFGRVSGLFTYVPILVGYMNHLFDQMVADNVQHIELRSCFTSYYDLQQNQYNDTWFMSTLEGLVATAKVTYNMPEFQVKIIGCNGRHSNQSTVMDSMIYSLKLRNQFPQTFVGYDLVGPEDEGYPLLYFIDQFAEIKAMGENYPLQLQYYFHAGETILYNNTNLYDAILLGTKRIGHGIQLIQHPLLLDMVIENQIGIEVCPISNQILNYVSDMRSHPAQNLIDRGVMVTISPDDPAIFGIGGLSYDFFEATYSWGLDLKQLKQLAINSIKQSATFNSQEQELLYNAWEINWSNFINYIITTYPSDN